MRAVVAELAARLRSSQLSPLWLVAALVVGVAGCGTDASGDTAPSSTPTTTGEKVATSTAGIARSTVNGGSQALLDQTPERLFDPRLVSVEAGVLVWGTTSSGDGAIAFVDAAGTRWSPIEAPDPPASCGAAVRLDDRIALIGNASVASEQVVGLLIEMASRTAKPFPVPGPLVGRCPNAIATESGLIAWTADPDAPTPVVAMAFDRASERWDPLPPPPFPTGTYDAGGVWTGNELILLASVEGQHSYLGARLAMDRRTWEQLPAPPVAIWDGADPIWSGDELVITSWWPQSITGGDVDPFPEPLAPGGIYRPLTGTWKASSLAPEWTDGAAVWTGQAIVWWRPGNKHATAYDPEVDTWWHIAAPTFDAAPTDGDLLWAAVWTGAEIVATEGSDIFSFTPILSDTVELDRSGQPRTHAVGGTGSVAGSWTGQLGLLGPACGFVGRNSITIDIDVDNNFVVDYVIDREEPCGSVIVHEGSITGRVDPASRQLVGDGPAIVDGEPAQVRCDCEITGDNLVRGELTIDGMPLFLVALFVA